MGSCQFSKPETNKQKNQADLTLLFRTVNTLDAVNILDTLEEYFKYQNYVVWKERRRRTNVQNMVITKVYILSEFLLYSTSSLLWFRNSTP